MSAAAICRIWQGEQKCNHAPTDLAGRCFAAALCLTLSGLHACAAAKLAAVRALRTETARHLLLAVSASLSVGARGFEPPASRTRTVDLIY